MKFIYGDYETLYEKPETIKEEMDFIQTAVGKILNKIPLDKIKPELETMEIFVKKSSMEDGPFCCDEKGNPVEWKMTVAINFTAEEERK